MNRRGLLRGIGALICAPSIVRASALMRISVLDEPWAFGVVSIEDIESYIAGEVWPLARLQVGEFLGMRWHQG